MGKRDAKNFGAIAFVDTWILLFAPAPRERAKVQSVDCQLVEYMRLLLFGQGRILLALDRKRCAELSFPIR